MLEALEEGKTYVFVFGQGVEALTGVVVGVGPDWALVEVTKNRFDGQETKYHRIRLQNVLYAREESR